MNWKKWIIPLLVFAGICLLVDRIFTNRIVIRPGSDIGRIQHLYQLDTNEVPVFGTSRVHALDFGTNAYNYGMEGATFGLANTFLQIELAKPKTTPIIIELQFQDGGVLGGDYKLIPFATDARYRQLMEQLHVMHWRYLIPGIRYFGYYDWLYKDYLNDHYQIWKVTRGYIQYLTSPPFDQAWFDRLVQLRLQMTNGYFADEQGNRQLLVNITSNPQRTFFLVIPPFHPACYHDFHNEQRLLEFETRLTACTNAVVIDWGRMTYPETSFLDTLHLRKEAETDLSQKFRDKINDILRERKQPGI